MRTAIAEQLSALGVQHPCDLHETLLIRNGLYCGRKYQCQGHQVIWFIEEDQLKIFSPNGQLLMTACASDCLARSESFAATQTRRAA